MSLLIHCFNVLKKYLLLHSKNSGSARNTAPDSNRDEPIYEEIPNSEALINDEALNADYEKPLHCVEPIDVNVVGSQSPLENGRAEPIYMEMKSSQSMLKSGREESIDMNVGGSQSTLENSREEPIYMEMRIAQPIDVSDDAHRRNHRASEVTAALLQLITAIAHTELSQSTDVPDYVNIERPPSTGASASAAVFITIHVNDQQCFKLPGHPTIGRQATAGACCTTVSL